MPAPDGVDRFYSRTCRAVVPARDAAAAVCHVFTNAARCSASWARDWWALSLPKRRCAMSPWQSGCTARYADYSVGAYDDPAAPFTVPDLRFRRPLPNGCRWINGCRRFRCVRRLLSTSVAVPVAGDAAMAGGDFRRLSAGRYSGDRCSAFQSEKRDLFGR